MTLLFHYPNAFEYSSYLRPQIKIEFGRGDQQPSEKSSVTPFVTEMFPDIFTEKSAAVIVLDCERTFWEKVTLLHAENHRPDPAKLKSRMARHWSDVAVMSTAKRFKDENLSLDLLAQVIRFKKFISPRIGPTMTPQFPEHLESYLTRISKRFSVRTIRRCRKCSQARLSLSTKSSQGSKRCNRE